MQPRKRGDSLADAGRAEFRRLGWDSKRRHEPDFGLGFPDRASAREAACP